MLNQDIEQVREIHVTEFINRLEKDQVKEITFVGNTINGRLIDGTQFTVMLPDMMMQTFYQDYLKDKVENGNIILRDEFLNYPS